MFIDELHIIHYRKLQNAEIIRKKNFNTVPVIDGTQGDLFKDKCSILYNSIPSSSDSMDALHERIRHAIETLCLQMAGVTMTLLGRTVATPVLLASGT